MRFLQLITGLVGLFWASQFYLIGMYGVPFSWWIPAIAFASLLLIVGALLGWLLRSSWAEWFSLIGAALLSAYFVPAIAYVIWSYFRGTAVGGLELAVRVATAGLTLYVFVQAMRSKVRGREIKA
jgi:hypothetical protein